MTNENMSTVVWFGWSVFLKSNNTFTFAGLVDLRICHFNIFFWRLHWCILKTCSYDFFIVHRTKINSFSWCDLCFLIWIVITDFLPHQNFFLTYLLIRGLYRPWGSMTVLYHKVLSRSHPFQCPWTTWRRLPISTVASLRIWAFWPVVHHSSDIPDQWGTYLVHKSLLDIATLVIKGWLVTLRICLLCLTHKRWFFFVIKCRNH